MVYRLVDIGGGVGSDSRGWIGVSLFFGVLFGRVRISPGHMDT